MPASLMTTATATPSLPTHMLVRGTPSLLPSNDNGCWGSFQNRLWHQTSWV